MAVNTSCAAELGAACAGPQLVADIPACIEEELWPSRVVKSDLTFSARDVRGTDVTVACEFLDASLEKSATDADRWTLRHQGCNARNWGNLLSVYWHARGAAALGGLRFESTGFAESWLRHLPRSAPPRPELEGPEELARACEACHGWKAAHPHACRGAWAAIRGQIQHDTQEAIRAFVASARGAVRLPTFLPEEVVVHLRLDLRHPMQRWPGRSSFAAPGVLPAGTRRVRILHQPYRPEDLAADWVANRAVLGRVHQDLYMTSFLRDRAIVKGLTILIRCYQDLLQTLCGPSCEVVAETGSQAEDFIKLATAPATFCTGSSFCLWAAMGNDRGRVHFPVGVGAHWAGHGADKPDLGRDWHWRAEPRLSNEEVHMFTRMTPEQVADWIWGH